MITREEYLELKELYNDGYRWIARDENGYVYVYYGEPKKLVSIWKDSEPGGSSCCLNKYVFPYIKWEDEKPTKINDLIRDYESHQIITGENTLNDFFGTDNFNIKYVPQFKDLLSSLKKDVEYLENKSSFEHRSKQEETNMNKSELIKEVEDILNDICIYDYQLGEHEEKTIWTISSITIRKIFSSIEKHSPVSVGENVKVTIPQFVADWIEEVKGLERRFKLEHLCDTLRMPKKVYDWLDEQECTTDILARAWLDGFIVNEDEPLYYALIKGHELSNNEFKYWSCNAYNSGDLFISSKHPKAKCINRMTKNNWDKFGINSSNANFRSEFKYWSCNAYNSGDLFIWSKHPKARCINRMTKNNWNKLGINSSNANF